MKKLIYNGVSAFCIGLVVVALFTNIILKTNPAETIAPILVDTLSLENGGEVNIELLDGVKYIHVTLNDFEYISKKKSVSKKVVSSLTALFARLEG